MLQARKAGQRRVRWGMLRQVLRARMQQAKGARIQPLFRNVLRLYQMCHCGMREASETVFILLWALLVQEQQR